RDMRHFETSPRPSAARLRRSPRLVNFAEFLWIAGARKAFGRSILNLRFSTRIGRSLPHTGGAARKVHLARNISQRNVTGGGGIDEKNFSAGGFPNLARRASRLTRC